MNQGLSLSTLYLPITPLTLSFLSPSHKYAHALAHTHTGSWFLCDLTPACSVRSILPPCWLQAGLFRPRSPIPGWTVSALCVGAIWPHCMARWDAAASPEPSTPEARCLLGQVWPLAQQIMYQFCHVNIEKYFQCIIQSRIVVHRHVGAIFKA